jgi:hypothetical protein
MYLLDGQPQAVVVRVVMVPGTRTVKHVVVQFTNGQMREFGLGAIMLAP